MWNRILPETSEEKAAVAQLQNAGWKVVLYLGGRGLLGPKVTKTGWEEAGADSFRRAISRPIFITEQFMIGQKNLVGLPQPWEMWQYGQQALSSPLDNVHQSSIGSWFIDARPVRANQQTCLRCHATQGAMDYPSPHGVKNSLRIGDALGVVIYRKRRKTPGFRRGDISRVRQRRTCCATLLVSSLTIRVQRFLSS